MSIKVTTPALQKEEANAVKAFRVRMAMARINIMKAAGTSQELKPDSSGYFVGEFDISGLPLPVKKHIITAGIIQGDIFHYGGGFASIKEITSSLGNSTSRKILHLQVRTLTNKSYEKSIEVVESLVDNILDPQKKTLKRLADMQPRLLKREFEIQSLMKSVISHIITKGIIKGEIYKRSGAVVNVRGSPYLAYESPQEYLSERPIYLLIQGPNETTIYWAVEKIQQLMKEAEEIITKSVPEIPSENSQRIGVSQDLENPSQASGAIGVFSNLKNLPKSSEPEVKNVNPIQETRNSLPKSFFTIQEHKPKPPPNSNPNPARIIRKQIRKDKVNQEKEKKKEEVKQTIELLKERHGTNSFWTMNHDLKREKTQVNSLVPLSNSYNRQFGSIEAPALQPSGNILSENLQQELYKLQMSMPVMQSTISGSQQLVPMSHGSKPVMKQAYLNIETISEGQQSKLDDSKDSSKHDPYSEVISKLQEFIQGANVETADRVESGSPLTAPVTKTVSSVLQDTSTVDQVASGDSPEESPLSLVIQQLQQYISSNSLSSSQKDIQKKVPSGEKLSNPNNPIVSEKATEKQLTPGLSFESEQESSKFKRKSTNPISGPPLSKRPFFEGTSRKPITLTTSSTQLKSESILHKQKDLAACQKPRPSLQKGASKSSNIFSSVSIIGDSLLQNARMRFGGSGDKDCREDKFNLARLKDDLIRFHGRGGKLNPYCVLMCGALDVIDSVEPLQFNKLIKDLVDYLLKKEYYVLLFTLPLVISSVPTINKLIPGINGLIMSYHTKPNVSVILFHKLFKDYQWNESKNSLLKSIHVKGPLNNGPVLSSVACDLIRELVEKEIESLNGF